MWPRPERMNKFKKMNWTLFEHAYEYWGDFSLKVVEEWQSILNTILGSYWVLRISFNWSSTWLPFQTSICILHLQFLLFFRIGSFISLFLNHSEHFTVFCQCFRGVLSVSGFLPSRIFPPKCTARGRHLLGDEGESSLGSRQKRKWMKQVLFGAFYLQGSLQQVFQKWSVLHRNHANIENRHTHTYIFSRVGQMDTSPCLQNMYWKKQIG